MLLLLSLLACRDDGKPADTAAPATPRPAGDAEAGWDVLRYGGYVGGGVPADLWFEFVGEIRGNLLDREGDAAMLPPSFNLFETPEGATVVGGVTCMGCHSSWIDGEYMPGLGDAFADFTGEDTGYFQLLLDMTGARYGEDSPEYAACERLVRGADAVAASIVTPFAGPTPAFAMELAAAAHRDPETLEWTDDPVYEVPEGVPPSGVPGSDVPPWWNVKKKTQLYYNGMGGGDLARLVEQTGVVAITDAAHAELIDAEFGDVLAWILALEAPVWPEAVDEALAAQGQTVFEASCSACHGTYGETEIYPMLRVDVDEVGTDPVYAEALLHEGFNDWLKASWYGQGPWAATFDAQRTYVAPPLDGVWATAPYLHNGSVPDLVALLDSTQRPAAWARDYDDSTYEHERVGWPWTEAEADGDPWTYDTSVPGYGNMGHTYGDALSEADRVAVLEYLKTL